MVKCFTSNNMNNIKEYREKELKGYVIANIILILLITGSLDRIINNNLDTINFIIELIDPILFSSMIYIYIFIIDSLVPWDIKEKIAYAHIGKLPGYSIFSSMKNGVKDNRFTIEQVLECYSWIYNNLPESKKEREVFENTEWYRIYSKYEKKGKVYYDNKDFLLCRDMVISTLSLIIIYVILTFLKLINFEIIVTIMLLIEAIIIDIAMRGKAKRLAYNVICEDIYSEE